MRSTPLPSALTRSAQGRMNSRLISAVGGLAAAKTSTVSSAHTGIAASAAAISTPAPRLRIIFLLPIASRAFCRRGSVLFEHRPLARQERRDLRAFVRDVDRHLLVSRDELPAIGRAAIMRRFDLLPNDVALGIDAIGIDRGRDHSADHHEATRPFLGPFDLAFEMARAFGDARRLNDSRGQRRKARFLDLADTGRERQADDAHLLEALALEAR